MMSDKHISEVSPTKSRGSVRSLLPVRSSHEGGGGNSPVPGCGACAGGTDGAIPSRAPTSPERGVLRVDSFEVLSEVLSDLQREPFARPFVIGALYELGPET